MKNTARQQTARFDQETPDQIDEGVGSEDGAATPSGASIAEFPARPAESQDAGGHASAEAGGKERKPMWKWAILAALIVGVVAWMTLRTPGAPTAVGAPSAVAPLELAAVDLATIEPRVLTRVLPLSGTMTPFVQATVKAEVGGEVEQVTVREGQDVAAGDIIARIDARNLQAQYDRELAGVEKARADMQLAQLNRDKNRSLLDQKFISQNTFEQTESAYAASVASFKLAEAQARVAKINLDDAVVRAPFSGTIAQRHVHPGEKVSPDSPLVTLVDLRQLVLEAAIPAADIPSVQIGQAARFQVGGFGQRDFEGQVQRINPVTTEGSRAITLYIAVPNADRALKGGMFAQGQLTLISTQPVLAAPVRAVREEAGANYVFTFKDGTIERTPVSLGAPVEGSAFVEVREGLAAGDRVIVAQIDENRAGSAAVVRGEPAAGAAAAAAN